MRTNNIKSDSQNTTLTALTSC